MSSARTEELLAPCGHAQGLEATATTLSSEGTTKESIEARHLGELYIFLCHHHFYLFLVLFVSIVLMT